MSAVFAATRFDGRSAAGEIVLLRFEGQSLLVLGRASVERIAIASLAVAEGFEHAPRMIGLPGGGTLEVADSRQELTAALALAGVRASWVVRLQRMWGAALAALAVLAALGAWAYLEGVPAASRAIVGALPPAFERQLGNNVLALLDRQVLKPTRLDAGERARIAVRFRDAAQLAAPGVEVRIEFRAGQLNAFALPGGIIVVMDELVRLAGSDEQVLGVLGHELGHVVGRHSTRQMAQALGVAALAGLVWGDFSSVAANVPVALGAMRYGRAFEVEADAFAVAFLRASGISPRPLVEFLQAIQARETRRGRGGTPELVSTHPDIGARIERMRRALEESAAERAPLR